MHIQVSTNEAADCEIHVNGCSVLKTLDSEDVLTSSLSDMKNSSRKLPPIICGNGQSK